MAEIIRGTTNTTWTMLYYKETIIAWLRCKKDGRADQIGLASATLDIGGEEKSGLVNPRGLHPEKDMVQCQVIGEVLGGDHNGWVMVHFAPLQDEQFRLSAPKEHLDAICEKCEVLEKPVSTPP